MDNDAITAFWQDYRATLPENERPATYTAWSFGDNPKLANELGSLVAEGTKTATCGSLWRFKGEGLPVPQVGELSIILDGEGRPLCIIETTVIEIKPYNEVDARFAADEGEGDRSLSYWREAHWRFFSRTLAKIGKEPTEDMPLVCERFRRVYP